MKLMVHTNCQFRDKHTVGDIVFYKHAFLVWLCFNNASLCIDYLVESCKITIFVFGFILPNPKGH